MSKDRSVKNIRGLWINPATRCLKIKYHRINILDRIKSAFHVQSPRRMLEFGPGLGCLIELGHEVWPAMEYHVADIDSGLLESLAGRFPYLQTHCIDESRDLKALDGLFDVIAAVDVWEHLPINEAIAYTEWCWQRLNPGGMLILQTPNWGCPVTPATFYSDMTHCTPFNEESIRHLFRGAGVPDDSVHILPRKTPGLFGVIRDGLIGLFGMFYRLVFVFFGAVRLKVFSADLVVVIRKPNE